MCFDIWNIVPSIVFNQCFILFSIVVSANSRTQDVAGSKLAFQSSEDRASVASAAVDGDNSTCTITEREREPYWDSRTGCDLYCQCCLHQCRYYPKKKTKINVVCNIKQVTTTVNSALNSHCFCTTKLAGNERWLLKQI